MTTHVYGGSAKGRATPSQSGIRRVENAMSDERVRDFLKGWEDAQQKADRTAARTAAAGAALYVGLRAWEAYRHGRGRR